MVHPDFKFLRAVGMMIGAVVGVGVFGIPYAFAQSGVALGLLELLFIGAVMLALQFMFAEVVLQTPGKHRLAGYVDIYLGRPWKRVATAAFCASTWGAMLAYMIIGGSFLHLLFAPILGDVTEWYSYAIAGIAGMFIYRGLQFASKLEVFAVGSLLFLFIFMILVSLPQIHVAHLQTVHWSNAFIPYGIILFALSSMGIIPEMKEILGSRAKSQLGHAILVGLSTVVLLYATFSFVVVGVTGEMTTTVAFEGLVPFFGDGFRLMTSLLGTITVVSIFIMLGIQLMDLFKYDYKRSDTTSWALTLVVPVVLYFFGFREFVRLIGFIGSVFGGTLGLLIVLTYLQMSRKIGLGSGKERSSACRKRHCLNFPPLLSWIVFFVFLSGIIFKLIQFLV